MTKFFFILFFSFLFFSCNHNRFSVDLSNVNLPIRFINLDSVVVHSDSNAFYTFCNSPIIDKGIISYLTKSCLQIGDVNNDDVYKRISIFRNDSRLNDSPHDLSHSYVCLCFLWGQKPAYGYDLTTSTHFDNWCISTAGKRGYLTIFDDRAVTARRRNFTGRDGCIHGWGRTSHPKRQLPGNRENAV